MDDNIPGSFSSIHGLALIEFISVIVLIGIGIWFVDVWVKWEGKNYDPSIDEGKLDIDYNFQAITVVFAAIVSICILIYMICGSVTASQINLHYAVRSVTLSVAIIPGVLGVILFLNGGMSYDAQKKINETYDDILKENAKKELRSRNIPYDNLGAASFAAGSIQIVMSIVILCYYYLVVAKKKPPPPPVYIPPPPVYVPPPVPSNYLENDRGFSRRMSPASPASPASPTTRT